MLANQESHISLSKDGHALKGAEENELADYKRGGKTLGQINQT